MSPFMAIYSLQALSERLDREATPLNSKEKNDSKRLKKTESYYKLLILKTKDKCSFASSCVSLLMGTYPAAAARRTGRACRLHWVLGCS